MGIEFDPIALIEHGYVVQPDRSAWMRAIGGEVTLCMDPGADRARAYTLGPQGPENAFEVRGENVGDEPTVLAQMRLAFTEYPPAAQRTILRVTQTPGITSSVEVTGQAPPDPLLVNTAYADASALIVHPLEGPPVIFTTLSRGLFRIDPGARAMWRKLAAHLGAGCRLSGRTASPDADDVECVLDAGGRVVHAEGVARNDRARELLRAAARDVDRARTRRGRLDPLAALELWRGLFAGRWTLVDDFDSDGKRFVLARRNDPQTASPQPLPLRQRQVLFLVAAGWSNKEVGYTLGIHEATVAAHLRRALSAVGASSRNEWIRLSSEVAGPPL